MANIRPNDNTNYNRNRGAILTSDPHPQSSIRLLDSQTFESKPYHNNTQYHKEENSTYNNNNNEYHHNNDIKPVNYNTSVPKIFPVYHHLTGAVAYHNVKPSSSYYEPVQTEKRENININQHTYHHPTSIRPIYPTNSSSYPTVTHHYYQYKPAKEPVPVLPQVVNTAQQTTSLDESPQENTKNEGFSAPQEPPAKPIETEQQQPLPPRIKESILEEALQFFETDVVIPSDLPEPHSYLTTDWLMDVRQLIHVNTVDGREELKVDDQLFDILQDVQLSNLVTVCIAGPPGVGKSYLANLLLDIYRGEVKEHTGSKGFPVFDKSKTPCSSRSPKHLVKSVGISGCLVNLTKNSNTISLLLLDSEAFGDTQNDDDHDRMLFQILTAVSDIMIWVSSNSFTEPQFDEFDKLANHAKAMVQPLSSKEQPVRFTPPRLMMVCRNFSSDISDYAGGPVDATDYLEARITQHRRRVNNEFQVHQTFDEIYRQRIGALLFPTGAEPQLLPVTPFHLLSAKFQKQTHYLRNALFQQLEQADRSRSNLSWAGWITYLKLCVNEINKKEPFDPATFRRHVQDEHCRLEANNIMKNMMDQVRSKFEGELPVEPEKLMKDLQDLSRDCRREYKRRISADEDIAEKYRQGLKERISRLLTKALDENEEHGEAVCETTLKEMEEQVEAKLTRRAYSEIDSLEEDLQEMTRAAEAVPGRDRGSMISTRVSSLRSRGMSEIFEAKVDYTRQQTIEQLRKEQKTVAYSIPRREEIYDPAIQEGAARKCYSCALM